MGHAQEYFIPCLREQLFPFSNALKPERYGSYSAYGYDAERYI